MSLVFGLHRSPQSVHLNGRWSDLPKSIVFLWHGQHVRFIPMLKRMDTKPNILGKLL